MEIKKNPKSNLENYSRLFVFMGLVLALYVTYIALEHKTYDRIVKELAAVSLQAEDIEDMVLTNIKPPSTPPPPPPPPTAPILENFKKVDDDVKVVETVIKSTDAETNDKVDVNRQISNIQTSSVVEEVTYEDVPFAAISNPPIFPGCEKKSDKKACLEEKLRKAIIDNFDTGLAEEVGLTGVQRILCQFKISYKGLPTDIKIKAPHPLLEKEAYKLISGLPQMVPANQNGKAVNLVYMIPIIFKIE